MFVVDIDEVQLSRLVKAVGDARKSLPRELSAAINATAKKTRLDIGRKIRNEIAVKKAVVESKIKLVRQAAPQSLGAQVTLQESARIPLRDFGARQTKAGVSFKISKKGKRATVQGAFQGPRPGVMNVKWRGRVFKRVGKERLPIVQLFGPSPWGVFTVKRMTPAQKQDIEAELEKQIERRINLNILRANKLVST